MGEFVIYEHIALASKVLAIAVVHVMKTKDVVEINKPDIKDWAVYIDSVPGINHKDEVEYAARHGDKQPVKFAAVLFPHLPIDKYRR